jgi:fatty-acid desaturase
MDILPPEHKEQVKEKYGNHIKWLKDQDPLTRATKGFESALDWMMDKDNQKHLNLFFENTRKYDKIRNEITLEIFPEWKGLFDKYEKN